jgi:NAD(P)-dependent dehydrogenase (short-subunit alcohol dehydrogenase family)
MDNILSLKDKVALITGASSGLGAHFANVLAAAGAKVVLGARRTERLEKLVEEIKKNGSEALSVPLDVTKAQAITAALDKAEKAFGPVTILINNAGVTDPQRFVDCSEASWDFTMNTNLKGAWRVARQVVDRLITHNLAGSIVNISSVYGLSVNIRGSAYAISKAAVIQMTKAMALELVRRDIRVNALCPGYFESEMSTGLIGSEYIKNTPSQRMGNLEELTGPLLLLASEAGSFITGVALPVDGGHLVTSL